MSQSLYELLALGARYVFAGLMLLVVLRAWRITIIDGRRAATLRRISPQTGLSGELVVTRGGGKARRGMKYPVIREGLIGSSRRSDIRIRHASVRRRHAYFQLTEDGLSIRAASGAAMRDALGHPVKSLVLPDGGELTLGEVGLLLVLNAAPEPAVRRHPGRHGGASPVDLPADGDDLFGEQPVLRRGQRQAPLDVDSLFDADGGDFSAPKARSQR